MAKSITKLKENFSKLFSRRFFQITIPLSLTIVVASVLLPIWQLMPEIKDKTAIPLHYNIHFGVDLFGAWWLIFLTSAIGFVIFFLNLILAAWFWQRDKVLSYFFVSVSLLTQILLFIATVFIVLLNLSYG